MSVPYKRTKSVRALEREGNVPTVNKKIEEERSKLLKKQWIDKKKNVYVWVPKTKEPVD